MLWIETFEPLRTAYRSSLAPYWLQMFDTVALGTIAVAESTAASPARSDSGKQ